MKVTKEQIKRLHGLLPKDVTNDKGAKAAFVYGFTNDHKRISTTQLTFNEANEALVSLGAKPFLNALKTTEWERFDYRKKSHSNILSLLMQLEWKTYSVTGKRYFADMKAFGNWLQTKAPVKKPLSEMSPQEVSKTIVALENMVEGDKSV